MVGVGEGPRLLHRAPAGEHLVPDPLVGSRHPVDVLGAGDGQGDEDAALGAGVDRGAVDVQLLPHPAQHLLGERDLVEPGGERPGDVAQPGEEPVRRDVRRVRLSLAPRHGAGPRSDQPRGHAEADPLGDERDLRPRREVATDGPARDEHRERGEVGEQRGRDTGQQAGRERGDHEVGQQRLVQRRGGPDDGRGGNRLEDRAGAGEPRRRHRDARHERDDEQEGKVAGGDLALGEQTQQPAQAEDSRPHHDDRHLGGVHGAAPAAQQLRGAHGATVAHQ